MSKKAPRKSPRKHKVNHYKKTTGATVSSYYRGAGKTTPQIKHSAVLYKDFLSRLPDDVEDIIMKHIKENGDIIYGAQSMNAQIPAFHRRETYDYDIFSDDPETSAKALCDKLNGPYGGNYYVAPALHATTWRVYNRGPDSKIGTIDDTQIVDKTQKIDGLKVKNIHSIKFHHIDQMLEHRKNALISDPTSFRKDKDLADIGRMEFDKR